MNGLTLLPLRKSGRRESSVLTSGERLGAEVFAVGRDGYRAALARRQHERARVAPALEDFRVRVAVRRVEADRDDDERGARRLDELRGRGGAEVFIGETFAQYICVCIT